MKECPTATELERLITGPVNDAALARLEKHITACPVCQERMAAIASVGTLMPDRNDRWTPSPPSEALHTALERLASEPPVEICNRLPFESGISLSFLQPSKREGFLGCLGQYEVRRVIGQGGNGIVLEAFDPLLKRTVAIKMLTPWTALDAENKQRFLREAQSAAALTHPHVVTIHAVDQINGLPFLVLEYVAGQTLHDRVHHEGKLPLAEVVRIGAQIARGLAAAHTRGLIHRDIKPANILLDEESGIVKITDFGLAKATGENGLTVSGTLLGTPEYMSPEQAARQQPDERSDIFSLGAVLYFAATGISPFKGSSLFETLDNVRHCQPRPLHQIDATLPNWFSELVHRLLAREAQDRLGWAAAVAEVLEQAGAAPTVVQNAPADDTVRVVTRPRADRSRRAPPWAIYLSAAGGFALIVAATWWLVFGGRPQPDSGRAAPLAETEKIAPWVERSGFVLAGNNGVYQTLTAAVAAAIAGDTIDIHGNGPFLTPPITIEGKRLSIRAAPGSKPLILFENPTSAAPAPLFTSDSDLTLEGLEVRWQLEPGMGISAASMLARSMVRVTRGTLLVSNCRMSSERFNGCVAGACERMVIRRSHFIVKNGMGVYWRVEPGGELEVEDCVLETRFGIAILFDGPQPAEASSDVRVSHTTFASVHALQIMSESPPRTALPFALRNCLIDADNLLMLGPFRNPRAKNLRPEDLPLLVRSALRWQEEGNVYRQGLSYLSRPLPGQKGVQQSAEIIDFKRWLQMWDLPPGASITGKIHFQERPSSGNPVPLALESIADPSGPLPPSPGSSARPRRPMTYENQLRHNLRRDNRLRLLKNL